MKRGLYSFIFVFLFLSFAAVYYYMPIGKHPDGGVFLTISTFLFAIFSGFFINKQNERYTAIRDHVAVFDGMSSALYRNFGYLGEEGQQRAGKILSSYYKLLITKGTWDFVFTQKVSFLSDMHLLLRELTEGKELDTAQEEALDSIIDTLSSMQIIRKEILAVRDEKMPLSQWLLLYVLVAIVVVTLSVVVGSFGDVLASSVKGAFAASSLFVMILLHRLRGLRFFENIVGESSGQDVLDIIEGRR